MKTTAAILVETGQPLDVDEVTCPALKPGQVLVEIEYSGLCHTQVHEIRGLRGPDRWVPHCLGHEGSGRVLEISPGVTRVSEGDRVALTWVKGAGQEVFGTKYDWNGRTVNAGPVTTLSKHAVVSENRLVRIPDALESRLAVLLGCALPTAFSAVHTVARPRAGDSFAVFGAGGIGLSALMAAHLAGCHPLIAVDINRSRLTMAREVGATDVIDAAEEDPVSRVRELCPGGVDCAVEATGKAEVIAQALQATRPMGGTTVVAGNTAAGETLTINPWEIILGKRLVGAWDDHSHPEVDFPRYAKLLAAGRLPGAALLSEPYALTDINRAVDDLEAGRVGRPLIDMRRS